MPEELRFSAADRHIVDENLLHLTSVGVDIGSSTSHLVFSRLELERRGHRYITTSRQVLYESGILLTPFVGDTTIDEKALGEFIARQYEAAGLQRSDIDTGALILTGVATERQNARAIGELFADEAGKFVSVSAGHLLEATMAAHGSESAARSGRGFGTVLNVDMGGGTTKFAVCQEGVAKQVAAIAVGARLVVVDDDGTIVRLENAGRRIGKAVGLDMKLGGKISQDGLRTMASYMADRVAEVMSLGFLSPGARELMVTEPLTYQGTVNAVTFSGGVSEFIYGRETGSFGDLGQFLGAAVKARTVRQGLLMLAPKIRGIRATVLGASQYTVQVSGNTIFLSPQDAVPVRNIPVVRPDISLNTDDLAPSTIQGGLHQALSRLDLLQTEHPVAVAFRWEGPATFHRLDSVCNGVVNALKHPLSRGNPLVLVCDRDIGGLLGIHLKQEMQFPNPVISIDGIELQEFDFIDIGSLLPSSGAVPVVIKSLVFPAGQSAQGKQSAQSKPVLPST